MNLLQGKTNQYLRDAILENHVDKARRYLTLKIGKADVEATTESGGFSMLHCAAVMGSTPMVMMLLQLNASIWTLTDDGYSALDLAIWKGHTQIIDILRSQGAIAPMKEPESLNGKKILHLGREATVVEYYPSTAIKTKSTRALHYATGENYLVNLWAGTDYKIIGLEMNLEPLRQLNYIPTDVGMDMEAEKSPSHARVEAAMEHILEGQAFFDEDTDDDDDEDDTLSSGPRRPSAAELHEMNDDDEDDDSESDDDDDVVVEKTVEVAVPPGPLGVLLDSGISECAVVQGFTALPSGIKGTIEASGLVTPGMYMIGINEVNASLMSLQQVIQLLGKLARKDKVIRFAVFRPKPAPKPTPVHKPRPVTPPSPVARPAPPSPVSRPAAAPTATSMASLVGMLRTGGESRRTSLAPAPIAIKLQSPPEAECVHCGVPESVHTSDACPYKP
ncbi:hypothetical protein SPRG_14228 [Saprolegnia parasitica CBS 223.65]|uniref:Uncharacterized protein n=1 Tax=Saprolegnia parasitica (strain CBS 223.65) TaxID=695850 RepID=A0A067BNL1_SAPPC|nr:hypothetical protein SPRG_14228 [Saprolegnia parasitica CBS 223.65]KDO20079.1 hypothetical protein SPRG_14228 [Saprolegnia parasitica CBS 223.65]|eukprot:XP_012209239.1 hypothetical protein SPRG_14228 [Saprolegnia parasitica CBS 223.65]